MKTKLLSKMLLTKLKRKLITAKKDPDSDKLGQYGQVKIERKEGR
jgi:hypothetical protein